MVGSVGKRTFVPCVPRKVYGRAADEFSGWCTTAGGPMSWVYRCRRGGDRMPQGKIVKDAALRAAAIVLAVLIFSTVPTSGIFAAEMHKGSGGSSSAGETGATSPQIVELMALLADPKVREWLEKQSAAEVSHNNKPAFGC